MNVIIILYSSVAIIAIIAAALMRIDENKNSNKIHHWSYHLFMHNILDMAEDDCENSWGRNLLPPSSSSVNNNQRNRRNNFLDIKEKNELSSILTRLQIAPFSLYWDTLSFEQNGSMANVSAILEVCGGNCEKCLCACGCYVVGGNIGHMLGRSTVTYWPSSGRTIPVFQKIQECSQICIETSAILPYCVDDFVGREKHEMVCLEHLHLKLTTARISGNEYKGLLIELELACNGASLSDGFLVNLARLMRHHKIDIIVDEVLTSGRCGVFLLTTMMSIL